MRGLNSPDAAMHAPGMAIDPTAGHRKIAGEGTRGEKSRPRSPAGVRPSRFPAFPLPYFFTT